MLTIKNLQASFEKTPILKGVNLEVKKGELHILLGPNGSGKSTLGKVLLAHPHYEKTAGKIVFEGKDLDSLETYERAQMGIFLSHQSPPAITGVPVHDLLRSAQKSQAEAQEKKAEGIVSFKKSLKSHLKEMNLGVDFYDRHFNEGASGGERRKMEIVSLLTLGAKFAFLDEIDSGIDVDALKAIVTGIKEFLSSGERSMVLVTHQEKILTLLNPTRVHIFSEGRIVESGGKELAERIHAKGFQVFFEDGK